MSDIVRVDNEVELEPTAEPEYVLVPVPDTDASQVLGNGITWDSVSPALNIAVTVSFVSSCTFAGTLFGQSVV